LRGNRLVIAVSGTPGTGKSTFAKHLARRLGASLIRLNEFVERTGVYEVEPDGTKAVGVGDLRREFRKKIKDIPGPIVVEGHLSHLLPKNLITHVVVLRSHPKVILKRLAARRYKRKKAMENAEAEALDIILWEAVKMHGLKVSEIDTTKKSPKSCVELFLKSMRGRISLRPGRISWLEEFLRAKRYL